MIGKRIIGRGKVCSRVLSVFDAIDRFTNRAGNFIAYVILIIGGIIFLEITARFVFSKPTLWSYDTAAMAFGVYLILPGGYCVLHQRHVRMDVLSARLSERGKAIVDLITSFLGFVLVGAIIWFGIPWAWESFVTNEKRWTVFAPILWPSKVFLIVGAVWFFIYLIMEFIRDLFISFRKVED